MANIEKLTQFINTEERNQDSTGTLLDRAIEEGRKITREECFAWLSQFTYSQKLLLLELLRAIHAEQERESADEA